MFKIKSRCKAFLFKNIRDGWATFAVNMALQKAAHIYLYTCPIFFCTFLCLLTTMDNVKGICDVASPAVPTYDAKTENIFIY